MSSPRGRYERALERLKQAARRHLEAKRRNEPEDDYRSDLEAARQAYEEVRRELG
jgi:hypothetical protein